MTAAHVIYERATAEWRRKLTLSAILVPFFCIPYFVIQRLPGQAAWKWPLGPVEEAIGFQPEWVWVYQSAYLLLASVPWLTASTPDDLRRYALGFVLASSIGFTIFLVMPIECPRPPEVPATGMYALLVSYDRPVNTFPSLHIGLAVYTVLFGARASRGQIVAAPRRVVFLALGLWVCAIGYAAVATRQHFVVDLPAGAVLAWWCHRQVWKAP